MPQLLGGRGRRVLAPEREHVAVVRLPLGLQRLVVLLQVHRVHDLLQRLVGHRRPRAEAARELRRAERVRCALKLRREQDAVAAAGHVRVPRPDVAVGAGAVLQRGLA